MTPGEIATKAVADMRAEHGTGRDNGMVYVVVAVDVHAPPGQMIAFEAYGTKAIVRAALECVLADLADAAFISDAKEKAAS